MLQEQAEGSPATLSTVKLVFPFFFRTVKSDELLSSVVALSTMSGCQYEDFVRGKKIGTRLR